MATDENKIPTTTEEDKKATEDKTPEPAEETINLKVPILLKKLNETMSEVMESIAEQAETKQFTEALKSAKNLDDFLNSCLETREELSRIETFLQKKITKASQIGEKPATNDKSYFARINAVDPEIKIKSKKNLKNLLPKGKKKGGLWTWLNEEPKSKVKGSE